MSDLLVDPLAPPPAPRMWVAVFPKKQRQLRVAVCPACWWGTPVEMAPQAAVEAARAHEIDCPGAAPAGASPQLVQDMLARQRLYQQRFTPSV